LAEHFGANLIRWVCIQRDESISAQFGVPRRNPFNQQNQWVCRSSCIKSWQNNPLPIAALNLANRGVVWAMEHFAVMGPVSARFGSVEALARVALVLFAPPVLEHLVRAGATEPGVEHLPWPPMPGID
jgi:hypothetical protein